MTNQDPDWGSYAFTADPGKPLREAKATIAALTEDLEALNGIIKGLRQMLADSSSAAEIEIERLRAERDEARRFVCNREWLMTGMRETPEQIAVERRWDCFKEDKP